MNLANAYTWCWSWSIFTALTSPILDAMQVNLLLLTSKLSLLERHLFSKLSLSFNRLLSLTTLLRFNWLSAGWVLAMQCDFLLLFHLFKYVSVPLLVYMVIKVHGPSIFIFATVQDWVIGGHSVSTCVQGWAHKFLSMERRAGSLEDVVCLGKGLLLRCWWWHYFIISGENTETTFIMRTVKYSSIWRQCLCLVCILIVYLWLITDASKYILFLRNIIFSIHLVK